MESQLHDFSGPHGSSLYGTTLGQSPKSAPASDDWLLPLLSQESYDQGESTAVCWLEPLPTAEELILDKLDLPAAEEHDFLIPDTADKQAGNRKRKAPTTKDYHWEPLKARILELHSGERLPIKKLRRVIQEETGFDATSVTYHKGRIAPFSRATPLTRLAQRTAVSSSDLQVGSR